VTEKIKHCNSCKTYLPISEFRRTLSTQLVPDMAFSEVATVVTNWGYFHRCKDCESLFNRNRNRGPSRNKLSKGEFQDIKMMCKNILNNPRINMTKEQVRKASGSQEPWYEVEDEDLEA